MTKTKRLAVLIRTWKRMQDKRFEGIRLRKAGRKSAGNRLFVSAWGLWEKAIVKVYGHNVKFALLPNGCKVEGAEYTYRQF